MNTQPEALRLADELCAPMPDYPAPTSLEEAAAAELRRLYHLLMEQHSVIYGLRLQVRNLTNTLAFQSDHCTDDTEEQPAQPVVKRLRPDDTEGGEP